MLKLTRGDAPESLVTLTTKHLLCQPPAQSRSEHLEQAPALTEHLGQRWGMAGVCEHKQQVWVLPAAVQTGKQRQGGRAGPVLGIPQPPGPAPVTSQVHRLNVLSLETIISGVQSTSRVWLLQHKLTLIKIK